MKKFYILKWKGLQIFKYKQTTHSRIVFMVRKGGKIHEYILVFAHTFQKKLQKDMLRKNKNVYLCHKVVVNWA